VLLPGHGTVSVALSAFVVWTVLAAIFSAIPVAFSTLVLGPLLRRLSRRNGDIDRWRYYGATTAAITVPWLMAGPYGLIASALMLISYGYPVAYFYLRFTKDSLESSPRPNQTVA
jgi:hypothetical protein